VRDRYLEFIAEHDSAWELAMAALAIAFVVTGFLEEEPGAPEAYGVIDLALTAVFVLEFASRLLASHDRAGYLRGHWVDAIAIVPTVRGVRVLRLLRLLRMVRAFAGLYRFVSHLDRLTHHRGLAWLVAAWLGVMVICSVALYVAENGINAAVNSPQDAIWWGIVTLTTVGYGDVYPVTPEGRLAATVLMLLGIGLFSGITATITSFLISTADTAKSPIELLGELDRLRDSGILTEAEFEAKKSELLARI
jgi:voltage-gated potassium channel